MNTNFLSCEVWQTWVWLPATPLGRFATCQSDHEDLFLTRLQWGLNERDKDPNRGALGWTERGPLLAPCQVIELCCVNRLWCGRGAAALGHLVQRLTRETGVDILFQPQEPIQQIRVGAQESAFLTGAGDSDESGITFCKIYFGGCGWKPFDPETLAAWMGDCPCPSFNSNHYGDLNTEHKILVKKHHSRMTV